jgi:hypothetical protein
VNIIGANDQVSTNLELDWYILCDEKEIQTNESTITICEMPSNDEI